MPLKRISIPSPNYSSRGGANVRLIVLHTAEGATTYTSLGSFFASPSSGVSSHVGIDDTPNTIGEYVPRSQKAWTAANANPVAVQAEMCAFASWSTATWHDHPVMLSNVAQWIAEESSAFNIPLVLLTPSQAQSGGAGVCQHRDLGTWGGNHSDCGNGFPVADVIQMAGGGVVPTPPTPPPTNTAPKLSVDYFGPAYGHNAYCDDVRPWQSQMQSRGWSLSVDGVYGPQSESICRQFQQEKALSVDGLVGPKTWNASWLAPVT